MRHVEAQSQRAVIRWWAFSHHMFKLPEHALFSVPNGGYRRPFEAKLLVAEGSRSGVPDLILLVPRGKFHGFLIEMKTKAGVVSKEQAQFLADAADLGYAVCVARSTEEAIESITNYLRL